MKILLINPNRYQTPPVPPLGLEYLENALRYSHHECSICDLCISDNPYDTLDEAINNFSPDIAGVTIRNIDTVIYQNNIFFLDEIKSFIDQVKKRDIPVVLGGAGYSFIPEGILTFLNADWGIQGPGEQALINLLNLCEKKWPQRGTIFRGCDTPFNPNLQITRGENLDYKLYLTNGGLLGFETQKGCFEHCSYCSEGSGHVVFKQPDRIIEEISSLTERGYQDFHLCDTEFNQSLSHCHAFLEKLIENSLNISWVVYMKSSPYDEKLFSLLKKSGASLVTLSIPTGADSLDHTKRIRDLTKAYSIKLAVDLLAGFPGETVEMVRSTIETLRTIRPDTIGVNATFRLYPHITITKPILSSPEYRSHLTGKINDNPDLIYPVFYNHITVETLQEIIGGDPLFKIEGFERTSNYERLTQQGM